ncbi:MAG: hypothetical protein KatS3mg111_3697 [Pirellulaceae bacterium]|nr:MAG: hypothetical protein KatS3mg111_3697 [Pirellulaceae bacterium]
MRQHQVHQPPIVRPTIPQSISRHTLPTARQALERRSHLRREADHRKDSQTAVPGSGEEDRDSSAAEDNQPSTQDNSLRLPKIIRFETLARCGDEVWIENNGQIYRLRRTRQGKLILTK